MLEVQSGRRSGRRVDGPGPAVPEGDAEPEVRAGDADVRPGEGVPVRATPVRSWIPNGNGVKLATTSRFGKGTSGERGLAERLEIGTDWPRMISGALCCGGLLVGALLVVTKSSIT